jgi:hypothetical protein
LVLAVEGPRDAKNGMHTSLVLSTPNAG